MKNLVGVKRCDDHIKRELEKAGIAAVKIEEKNKGEVSYTIVGRLGTWELRRAWCYWIANSKKDIIPYGNAADMHDKEYPSHMFEPETRDSDANVYGDVIRAYGDGNATHPKDNKFVMLANGCSHYHIDTQEGLNEFARTVKKLL